jgi:hypothetical protein
MVQRIDGQFRRTVMKALIAVLVAGLAASPVAAAAAGELAGVSDRETSIPSGGIKQYYFGKGDVLFVSDRVGRWYRVQLNTGCLATPLARDTVAFEPDAATGRIDRFSAVRFLDDRRYCRIDSIRRSAPPPQIDSHSAVTLD